MRSDSMMTEILDEGTPAAEALAFKPLLDEEEEKRLCDFLAEEIRLSITERSGEEKRWKTIRRQRYGEPEFEKKDTPWPDASNIVPPGLMISQNTVYGMTKNAYGARTPFWSVKAFRPKEREDVAIAETVERFMEILATSRSDLNKREVDREIQEEMDLLGTVFVKVPWSTHTQTVPLPSPSGTTQTAEITFHDGPEWIVVPREDAYYRIRSRSVQSARWWAHHFELEENEVEERFASGAWTEWDTWRASVRTEATLIDVAADKSSGGVPSTRKVWDFYETFVKWQLGGEGPYVDLLVVVNTEARRVVAARRNELGIRPLREFNFIKKARRLDGFGVGQAGTHMQSELETQHNQRMDSVHFSGLRMLIARKNCGIKAREVLKPGKILFVDNIREDVMPFQAGEVYPSSLQSESLTWQYLQKATLQSDTMAGFADQTMKTRDSIGMQTNRMKASSGLIGAILEAGEDSYADLGMLTFFQLVFNKDRVLENERKWGRLTDDELANLEKALSIPIEEIPVRLVFTIRTTDVEQTYEMRRQNVLTLISIYSMFQKMNLPLMMQMGAVNPQTGQPAMDAETKKAAMRMITGNARLMEKTFEFFGEDQTGDYVPSYQKMELALDIQDAMEGTLIKKMEAIRGAVERAKGEGLAGQPDAASGQLGGAIGSAGVPGAMQAPGGNLGGMQGPAGSQGGPAFALPQPGSAVVPAGGA
jgi:hypothetical protein